MNESLPERGALLEALQKSEERFRLAAQAGKMFAYEWEAATDVITRSGECADILGVDETTPITGQQVISKVHPDDQERLVAAMARLSPEEPQLQISYRMIHPDGRVIWVERNSRAHFDEQGRMLRVVGMIADITQRKRAEETLQWREAELAEAQRLAKLGSWQWDPDTDTVTWSEELYQLAGRDPKLPAVSYREHPKLYTAESWERLKQAVEEALRTGTPYELDLEMVRTDGTTLWLIARGEAKRDNTTGRIVLLHGTVQDITERKRTEEALRDSEERFRLVADSAPVLIRMSGPSKLCNYFNQPWLEFTGRPLQAEFGNGWTEGIHAEDLERCLETYTQAFDQRHAYRMDYRLRRHDGEYRWVLDSGVPRLNPDGSFAGYIGCAVDVHDRKKGEEVLATLSGRLLEAQEKERRRIARELHDDISQRLALLAIELENFRDASADSLFQFRDRTEQLIKHTSEISSAVQALSHELHSSKLEYLGIVVAMKSFCTEFAEQQKVEIDFTTWNVPQSVPQEVSLCLFRVLQEALRNAVKHSGVRQFEAQLQGVHNELHLTIRDSGVGFEPGGEQSIRGLGLVSMRERAGLVGGTLSVVSKPMGGTEIRVRVPLAAGTNTNRMSTSA